MTPKKLTPKDLFERMKTQENVVLLDVRAKEKYDDFHIEGSSIENLHIHKGEIFKLEENNEEVIDSLPRDKEIVVTCTTGNSAAKCANILSQRDYKVLVLEGGITAWQEYLKTK